MVIFGTEAGSVARWTEGTHRRRGDGWGRGDRNRAWERMLEADEAQVNEIPSPLKMQSGLPRRSWMRGDG